MTRGNPEHALQVAVARFLKEHLHPSVQWTASLTGTNLGVTARNRAKAAGVRRGWPDFSFLHPQTGVTHFAELKAGSGLSLEQRVFRDTAAPHGIWCVARSVSDVRMFLTRAGFRLRAHPFERFEDEPTGTDLPF